MKHEYDVGVVGYGPSSAVLVNLLLEQGLSVIVFERDEDIPTSPRAAHFDDESLRLFQTIGAADDLAEYFSKSKDYGVYNALGKRVWGFSAIGQVPTDQGWLSDYWFFQPRVERYLRAKNIKQGATALLNREVIDLTELPDGVVITHKNTDDETGTTQQQTSVRYVVGADGAKSFVRKYIGTSMEKLAPSQRWMIVDIKIHAGIPVELESESWTRVSPNETITYVPMPEDIQRFEFSMKEDQSEDDVKSPEAITEFIAKWFQPDEYDILRADVYHFHSLVADEWKKGRVLIAGDAAHLNPPFLGQGVCAAFRDAANLAWKLARVVRDGASEALLDTYMTERRPHAREIVKIAGEVGNKIAWMASASPEELNAMGREDYKQAKPPLGPGVFDGNFTSAGVRAPQPVLSNGRMLDYAVGYNFALVGDSALISAISSSSMAALKALRVVILADDCDSVRNATAAVGGKVMFVRPDRYLIGVANSISEIEAMAIQAATALGSTVAA
ncbi:bifunctional 3-(3-hydroxy-phenyl)propionate/3-hydroxycinnamic acid hydroxylase [Sphingobium subterraneum]|uniref:3-(3-hydroxy-phenyl)propionate hydroxylase n=1 Tax=Sphingobium subterraneum TaxID=627688 RepID=A0A841J226_9SPHN|nr:bifunctional 3-(3-hydroxy-phenyl)propionate/3-hydroxycinnamic acid hydroxylase [Sphingobium subterraneum]MBB6125229.1 3-(3-hydroxy-phenyl)propionate hydroxylase [Sphingobium subterraneum]